MEYRSCMKRNGTKIGKKKQFWANSRSGTGTTQQKPIGIGTGTTQQNQIGTGTDQSGTGTTMPKMLRLLYFLILKHKIIHR